MTQTATSPSSTQNEVTFTGYLGRDPEANYTKNGTAITKFSIAVNQGKDKPAMWLNIETWKALAEECNERLKKGSFVEIKGRLVQDVWKDKEDHTRYSFKVTAQTVRLLKKSSSEKATGFLEEEVDEASDPLGNRSDHPF